MPTLATRCPHCQAVFRVVADQLKLRDGLVRCGVCQKIFDGSQTLQPLDTEVAPVAADASVVEGADAASEELSPEAAAIEATTPPVEIEAMPPPVEIETAAPAIETETPAPAKHADSVTGSEPTQPDKPILPMATPEFLRSDRPVKRRAGLASVVALLVLGGTLAWQGVVQFRGDIAAHWPPTRPVLQRLCAPLGCAVDWPARSELLAVVGADLQSLPNAEAFELNAVVRNRATLRMQLPALEVTLSDLQNRPIARRILHPIDYLDKSSAKTMIPAGFAAGADLEIKVVLQAPGLKVAGFVVYPFYP
jgi:predicted Zn finger-like uncharacterized protein